VDEDFFGRRQEQDTGGNRDTAQYLDGGQALAKEHHGGSGDQHDMEMSGGKERTYRRGSK